MYKLKHSSASPRFHPYKSRPESTLLQITLDVEAREQHNHGRHVSNQQPVQPVRHLAVAPTPHPNSTSLLHQIHHVHQSDQNELHQLQLGQVRSPPALEAQDRAQVVSVHQHVHEGVQEHRHTVVTVGVGKEEQTDHDGDAAVVVHMQERHLAVGLAQNENESVQELPVLLDVEHVEHTHKLLGLFRSEINVAAAKHVSLQIIVTEHSVEAVSSQAHANEVVHNHELLRVESLLSSVHNLHEYIDRHEVENVSNDHGLVVGHRERAHILHCVLYLQSKHLPIPVLAVISVMSTLNILLFFLRAL